MKRNKLTQHAVDRWRARAHRGEGALRLALRDSVPVPPRHLSPFVTKKTMGNAKRRRHQTNRNVRYRVWGSFAFVLSSGRRDATVITVIHLEPETFASTVVWFLMGSWV